MIIGVTEDDGMAARIAQLAVRLANKHPCCESSSLAAFRVVVGTGTAEDIALLYEHIGTLPGPTPVAVAQQTVSFAALIYERAGAKRARPHVELAAVHVKRALAAASTSYIRQLCRGRHDDPELRRP